MALAQRRQLRRGEQRRGALGSGQQDARFLERLAEPGEAEAESGVVERLAADAGGAQREVLRLDLAAGEDEGAGGEARGLMARRHQDLETARAVAQQEERGGR